MCDVPMEMGMSFSNKKKIKASDVSVASTFYHNADNNRQEVKAALLMSTYGKQGHIFCCCCCDVSKTVHYLCKCLRVSVGFG
jgi:hypothetical protein